MFHDSRMERFAPALAHTILGAPAWARVGITAPDARMREQAALELARTILDHDEAIDPNQLLLTL